MEGGYQESFGWCCLNAQHTDQAWTLVRAGEDARTLRNSLWELAQA
jgi:hypothetical protein